MVAGTGRFDTSLMEIFGERAFVKSGAEGVHCGVLPELGYGIAIKIDDGATRAAQAAMAALIGRYLPMSDEERLSLESLRSAGSEELERHRSRRDPADGGAP